MRGPSSNLKRRAFRAVHPALRTRLLRSQIFLGVATDPSAMRQFCSKVRPVLIDHPLMRVGGQGDGGYLVPDDLDGVDICFSPGVSRTADFERALARRGVRSYMADFSVDGPPCAGSLFDFEKKHLGVCESETEIRLDTWVNAKAPDDDEFILQIDIEGAEYAVLLDASREVLRRSRILVIEFHLLDRLFEPAYFEIINATMSKLLEDFCVVHIHPNNFCKPVRCAGLEIPSVMEFTFLRRDRAEVVGFATEYPHVLDRPNDPHMRDVVLPKCWRS